MIQETTGISVLLTKFTGYLLWSVDWKTYLAKDKTDIDWVVSYNTSYRDQPDYKRFRYNVDGKNPVLLVPQGSAQTFNLGRTWRVNRSIPRSARARRCLEAFPRSSASRSRLAGLDLPLALVGRGTRR